MIITLEEYLHPHLPRYADLMTPEFEENAQRTVDAANVIIEACGLATWKTSGWRPAPYNANIKGADPNSPHVTAEAIDLADLDGALKKWIIANRKIFEDAGFAAIENPMITPTWAHLQTREALSWQIGQHILLARSGWRNKRGEYILP